MSASTYLAEGDAVGVFDGVEWAGRLYERAMREQWDVDEDVEWPSLGIERFPPAVRKAMAPLYGQIQLGEVLTAGLVGRVRDRVDEPWARTLAHVQAVDEVRHAEFFSRVMARLGEPPPGNTSELLHELSCLEEPDHLLLGTQVVLEGFANCVFEQALIRGREAAARRIRISQYPHPLELLTTIATRVGGDESRHVAFGVLYLRRRVVSLPAPERTKLQDVGVRLAALGEQAIENMSGGLAAVGIDARELVAQVTLTRQRHFRSIGFDT